MASSPNTETMIARWADYAAEMASARYNGDETGELVVLGSGISIIDLTRDAEKELCSADAVFHCVYDKVTQAWIGELRPDAYDLCILYDEDVERHLTYVRMAEAILHRVRCGQKVVAFFYGHPGIFAMPAHRAVHIARHEGHRARMRAGVSALDHLVADIGFDPALPGMASFEATDLLLRGRQIDPTLHIVLWQVGVVGEFQFKPGGFENTGYSELAARLIEVYGEDWEVTHYIAPQYVGIDPLIERIRIGALLEPEQRKNISSLSTFYIEPKDGVLTDIEMSSRFGRERNGASDRPRQPLRTYDYVRYGPREAKALRFFGNFTAPDHYRLAPQTPEYRFMLGLSDDLELERRYREDPAATVIESDLTVRDQRTAQLLAIPHPRAIDAALGDLEISEQVKSR
ncbi:MAG: SAM-dependent methyltransferase [Pseudomonadota bacterium]